MLIINRAIFMSEEVKTMKPEIYNLFECNPVIAAVKDFSGLKACCENEENKVVFILFGDICNINQIVRKVNEAGKAAFVHIDLITGLSSKEISVDFIKNNTDATGVISTKPALVKRAKELSLVGIFRVFVLDSMAIENLERQMSIARPDILEILPGVMPKVVGRIAHISNIPLIASGLISDKEDVMMALEAGAMSISTTNQKVWLM